MFKKLCISFHSHFHTFQCQAISSGEHISSFIYGVLQNGPRTIEKNVVIFIRPFRLLHYHIYIPPKRSGLYHHYSSATLSMIVIILVHIYPNEESLVVCFCHNLFRYRSINQAQATLKLDLTNFFHVVNIAANAVQSLPTLCFKTSVLFSWQRKRDICRPVLKLLHLYTYPQENEL